MFYLLKNNGGQEINPNYKKHKLSSDALLNKEIIE